MKADAAIEIIRSALQTVDESCSPGEADRVYGALIGHIRARRPESVSPLGVLPPPGPIVDPRSRG